MKKNIIIFVQSVVIILLTVALVISCAKKPENTKTVLGVKSEQINSSKDKTKNVLFIGNSITLHGICNYWWGEWGMAASDKNNDYVHILSEKISKTSNVNFDVINFATWELNSHDRAEISNELTQVFDKSKYDYVVLQLGENISDTLTLKRDFVDLVNYIKVQNNSAKIIMVGNFWKNPKVESAKNYTCKKTGIICVDLSDIQNEIYYAKKGTNVFGNDKTLHKIDHDGVAKHPNDKAMQIIAEKIYSSL